MNEFITTILHESGPATKRAPANTNMSAGANCHYAEIRVVQLRPELFGEHLLVLPAFSRLKVD